jgi:hypothetical protein
VAAAAVGILVVLAGALSTFSHATLADDILVLAGFVSLGVMIREGCPA